MLATSFFLAGYTFRKMPDNQSRLWIGLMALFIVAGVTFFFTGSMGTKGWAVFPYFAVAMTGSVGVVNLAGLIKGNMLKALDYIGSKTLYILTFHFIAFKLVSLMWIGAYNWPIHRLSDFPVISGVNMFSWIIYSIIGVIVPLGVWEVSQFIQSGFRK